MIDFFGFNELLSKNHLWDNDDEYEDVIERVEDAMYFDLPEIVLNEVFPGKDNKTVAAKEHVRLQIIEEYPRPPFPAKALYDCSEQDLRKYILLLSYTFKKQFEKLTMILFDVQPGDEDYKWVLNEFARKVFCNSNVKRNYKIFGIIWAFITVVGAIWFSPPYVFYWVLACAISLAIIIVVLRIMGLGENNYFHLSKNYIPKL